MRASIAWWGAFSVNRFLEPVEIRSRPARTLVPYASALALLGVWAAGRSDLPGLARLALTLAIGLRLAVAAWRHSPPANRDRVERAVLRPDGSWQLLAGAGDLVGARLVHAWGTSTGPVVGLEWQCDDGRRRRTWITRHDLSARSWRRLRARLRMA